MTLHDLCAGLLPPHGHLRLERMVTADQRITLVAAITAPKATCPDCAQPSTHIHSRYRRLLADLPWATTPMQLHLSVRRFFCDAPHCGRRTFTERLPRLAPRYARTTNRLTLTQTSTGLALGGAAGPGSWPGRAYPAAAIR
jgi:transposase